MSCTSIERKRVFFSLRNDAEQQNNSPRYRELGQQRQDQPGAPEPFRRDAEPVVEQKGGEGDDHDEGAGQEHTREQQGLRCFADEERYSAQKQRGEWGADSDCRAGVLKQLEGDQAGKSRREQTGENSPAAQKIDLIGRLMEKLLPDEDNADRNQCASGQIE